MNCQLCLTQIEGLKIDVTFKAQFAGCGLSQGQGRLEISRFHDVWLVGLAPLGFCDARLGHGTFHALGRSLGHGAER
jgi:hypothetical protein